MNNYSEKDFNRIFWRIFGVNYRVYKASDILYVERDKQADEKVYNNYLLNDELLSNKKILEFNSKEADDFHELFKFYLIGSNENTNFYVNQLNNITYNFRIFKKINQIDYNYIDLFAFQIAAILEHMNSNLYDTNIFDEAVKKKSIVPFLDYCKKENNIKTNKNLSIRMSYALDKLIEHWSKTIKTKLPSVTPSSFEKNISNWKKGKELPSFINILTTINVIFENKKKKDFMYVLFFQLLIVRALLYIEREDKISENSTNRFLNHLQFFRNEIRSTYKSNNKKEDFETLQEKYLVDISCSIESSKSLSDAIELTGKKFNSFMNKKYSYKELIIKIPNRDKIRDLFNEKKYDGIFTLLLNNDDNNLETIMINIANSCIRLLTAIKLEDKVLIKQYYKDFDRLSLGCLLSISDTEFNSQELINVFKNLETLDDNMDKMNTYLKEKLSTLG